MFKLNKLTIALLSSIAVTACGGGGSGDDPKPGTTGYSLEVHVNGKLNQTSANTSAASSAYKVCLDTNLDNSCAGEATEQETDAGGTATIEWDTGKISKDVADSSYVLAYPADGSTDEVLKYQLNRLKLKSEKDGKGVYNPLELNAVTNIQRILGQRDFANTIGAPENSDFATLDPSAGVRRVLLNSFIELGFGSKDADAIGTAQIRTLIENAYSVLGEATNKTSDYDSLVQKVLDNFRADYTANPFHDLITGPLPGPNPVAMFDYAADECKVSFTDKSTAPEGKTLSYVWRFGDGLTGTVQNPVHDYKKSGTYNVTLVVSDSVAKDEKSKEVTVSCQDKPEPDPNPHPPVADFRMAINGLTVTFINASSDADGDSLTYEWDFGDGQSSKEPNPVHTYATVGNYTVKLTARDKNFEDIRTASVFKPGPDINHPPVAKFGIKKNSSDGTVAFENQSSDPDEDDTLTYKWNFGDKYESTEASPVHKYAESGDYKVTLVAYDGKDYSEISTMTVHVEIIPPPGPLRPEADFSYEVNDNLTVQFTDKSKHNGYDIDDVSVIYEWNFGDGSYSTEKNPSHKYDEYKTYTVVLTVTYEDGEEVIESSKSVQITIPEPDDVLDCTL
ncbi:PKD domain-containing protein [Ruminobacter sp.]|uniref:PKD domain-containing protein n=1 Tax=Ruminobacter sp. TaxID=2774296 RepID=UPI00386FB397